MDVYFDPVPLLGPSREVFLGQWPDRKWLNVPGPLYGAETDNCGTGRLHAPGHVLYLFWLEERRSPTVADRLPRL